MKSTIFCLLASALFLTSLHSCSLFENNVSTPDSEKLIPAFHQMYYASKESPLLADQLALYVDYSTCIAEGQHSRFFRALIPSWKATATSYYGIEGKNIVEHDADSTYTLLSTIHEVNYADLKTAAERIAKGNTEAVLLTDGEYYEPSIAKGNVNNPYLTTAFKTWLKKGHDIYILSEPYVEVNHGQEFQKKRFYFLFTDRRLTDNIYSRVMQTVRLADYPGAEGFHLSACDPQLFSKNGQGFTVDAGLSAKVTNTPYRYEVQNWEVDWSSVIEPLFVSGVDSMGNAAAEGNAFATELFLDCNSIGGYRIDGVQTKVLNINQEYADFVAMKEAKQKVTPEITPTECENFIKVDDKAFGKNKEIKLCFETQMYNPDGVLTGEPFNYFMVQIFVNRLETVFAEQKSLFDFQSIDLPGQDNVSVSASIEQCLVDPEIKEMIMQRPIYTVFVKANQK